MITEPRHRAAAQARGHARAQRVAAGGLAASATEPTRSSKVSGLVPSRGRTYTPDEHHLPGYVTNLDQPVFALSTCPKSSKEPVPRYSRSPRRCAGCSRRVRRDLESAATSVSTPPSAEAAEELYQKVFASTRRLGPARWLPPPLRAVLQLLTKILVVGPSCYLEQSTRYSLRQPWRAALPLLPPTELLSPVRAVCGDMDRMFSPV